MRKLRKLLLVLILCLLPSAAFAQCTGIFPANTVCGNFGSSPAPPTATTLTTSLTGPSSSTSGFIPNWLGTAGIQLGSQNTITTSQVFNFTNTISGSGANNLASTTSLFVANITSNLYYKGTLVNLLSGGGGCTISASTSGYVLNAGSLGCTTPGTLTTSGGNDTETGTLNFVNTGSGFTHITSINNPVLDKIQNLANANVALTEFGVWNSASQGVTLFAAPPAYPGQFAGAGEVSGANGLYVNGNNIGGMFFSTTGLMSVFAAQILSPYTIGSLPACNGSTAGALAYVSNGGVGATYYSTVLATGTSPNIVLCTGSNWTYH